MTPRVELPAHLAARLRAEARAAAPRECCGLVEGVRAGDLVRVMALHPARNLDAAADRFRIDPRDQFVAQRTARAHGRAIVGCYHSHPGGAARPSAADLAGAGEEDFLWLIAADAALGAFIYRQGGFAAAELAGQGPAPL